MKKRPIATLTLFSISIILLATGLGLAVAFEDSFHLDNPSALMFISLACIGVAILVFGVAFAFLIFPLARAKEQPGPVQLDERQTMYSGKGAEYGLSATAFAALGMYLWESAGLPQFAQPSALLILTALLGIFVYIAYRIWNDAYFAVNRNRKSSVTLTAILGFVLLLGGISDLLNGRVIVNGLLTKDCFALAFGVTDLLLLAVIGLKALKDRKDEDA